MKKSRSAAASAAASISGSVGFEPANQVEDFKRIAMICYGI